MLGDNTFMGCKELKQVTFREGSRLEEIRSRCFRYSGIEEIAFPKTLRIISTNAFEKCEALKIIHVDNDCECCFSYTGIPTSVKIILPQETVAWTPSILKQQNLKDIVIHGEIEIIGNYWFWGSNIESVEIPSDIIRIGVEAFYNCKRLKNVVFKKMKTARSSDVNGATSLAY